MSKISPRSYDLKSLKLTAEEGFVLSRVDAPMSLEDLVSLCGMETGKLETILHTLASQGAVELEGVAPAPAFGAIPELEPTVQDPDEAEDEDDDLEDITLPRPSVSVAAAPAVQRVSLSVGGVCDVGKARSNNEDALAVSDLGGLGPIEVLGVKRSIDVGDGGVLLAVSDGMGGENAGEVASAMVLETLQQKMIEAPGGDPAAALATAVQEANTRVMAAAEQRELAGMGATLIAFLVAGDTAITAEIGDSRAYVLRSGKLSQISQDQSHVGLLVAQGILTPEQVKTSRAKNVILQACGKLPELVVAQRALPLKQGDRLLLCSDGLTLHVEDAEIETVLAGDLAADAASAKLVAMANERGGKDNVTVLVADVGGAAPPAGPDETVASTLTVIREFGPGAEP